MAKFLVYTKINGLVARVGDCADADLALQAQEGEVVIANPPADVEADGRWSYINEAFTQRGFNLDELKAQKLAQLKDIARQRLAVWNNLQIDDTSMGRMATAVTLGQAPEWIMADNTRRAFADAAEFLEVVQDAARYKAATVLYNSDLKSQIKEAPSIVELELIYLDQGWPT